MTDAPTPWQVNRMLADLRAAIATLEALDLIDDATLMFDTIEGQTNAFEVIDAVVAAAIEAEALAEATRAQAARLAERAARFERRNTVLRGIVLAALQTIGQRRLERPGYTVSTRQNQPELLIDETALQPTYLRVKREPDRPLIRKHLDQGYDVPGAQLGNASQGITIKV